MPREVEVKSVVVDETDCRRRIEAAGARLMFEGRLEDRRYDTADRRLTTADELLRVRTRADDRGVHATLEWKGPTRHDDGYKVREEIVASTTDAAELAAILERIGYAVIGEIDRDIVQYTFGEAMIRFERYPRMDVLVEVEGAPASIERAIEALGMPRAGFSGDRLPAFIARFESRTGTRAALNRRHLSGDAATDG